MKKLLFLILSSISLNVFGAESAGTLDPIEELLVQKYQINDFDALALQEKIETISEIIDEIKAAQDGIQHHTEGNLYLQLLIGSFESDKTEENRKKVVACLKKISSKKKRLLKQFKDQEQAGPAQLGQVIAPTTDEKILSTKADRKKRAQQLRNASAQSSPVECSVSRKEPTYSLEIKDTGVTLEKDGALALAYVSIIDCQNKLELLGEKIVLVSDAGLCPCCGIIDNSKQIIHHYFVRTDKENLTMLPAKIGDFRLDRKPNEWLSALQSQPGFTTWEIEKQIAAKKIVEYFLVVKDAAKNKKLLAQALQSILQYHWGCFRKPGIIGDDGKILPPTK